MMNRVRVVVMDFKNEQLSTVVEQDGYYTIFLNDRMCYECKQCAYLHELNHILHSDFMEINVDEIELKSHE